MKTALEWFQELPEDIRDKAMAYCKFPERAYSNRFLALECSFRWHATEEGSEYWMKVANGECPLTTEENEVLKQAIRFFFDKGEPNDKLLISAARKLSFNDLADQMLKDA